MSARSNALRADVVAPGIPTAGATAAPPDAAVADDAGGPTATRPATPGFAEALLEGLTARPRAVAPKWFYDAEGSALFERICRTPEYYPTRTETALLARVAGEIAARLGPGVELVEFGAGACEKAALLLDRLAAPRRFVPVDISGEHLHAAATRLRATRPWLDVRPLAADFTAAPAGAARGPDGGDSGDAVRGFRLPPAAGRRVGFFPGSSIGNWEPDAAARLLSGFREALAAAGDAAAPVDDDDLACGSLLVGVDLVKEPALLHAAYNDAEGVTAAFNRNLLARANRELGAGFVLADWAHAAFYQPRERRIEMHLVARRATRATIAGVEFAFAEGDSVHTENSCKYTVDGFRALARRAGFEPAATWTDPQRLFSIHWLLPRR